MMKVVYLNEKSVAAPVSGRKEKEPSTVLPDADSPKRRSTAYDEIAKDRQLVTVTTRSAARREPISILLWN